MMLRRLFFHFSPGDDWRFRIERGPKCSMKEKRSTFTEMWVRRGLEAADNDARSSVSLIPGFDFEEQTRKTWKNFSQCYAKGAIQAKPAMRRVYMRCRGTSWSYDYQVIRDSWDCVGRAKCLLLRIFPSSLARHMAEQWEPFGIFFFRCSRLIASE